jgi:hypothetical protein
VADEWIHEDDLRPALVAVEAELALALTIPDRLAVARPVRLRLLRLRLLLAAVLESDRPLGDVLADLRADLAEPLPAQAKDPGG